MSFLKATGTRGIDPEDIKFKAFWRGAGSTIPAGGVGQLDLTRLAATTTNIIRGDPASVWRNVRLVQNAPTTSTPGFVPNLFTVCAVALDTIVSDTEGEWGLCGIYNVLVGQLVTGVQNTERTPNGSSPIAAVVTRGMGLYAQSLLTSLGYEGHGIVYENQSVYSGGAAGANGVAAAIDPAVFPDTLVRIHAFTSGTSSMAPTRAVKTVGIALESTVVALTNTSTALIPCWFNGLTGF